MEGDRGREPGGTGAGEGEKREQEYKDTRLLFIKANHPVKTQ